MLEESDDRVAAALHGLLNWLEASGFMLAKVMHEEAEGDATPVDIMKIGPLREDIIQQYMSATVEGIQTFDSLDGLMAHLEGQREYTDKLDQAVMGWQRELEDGDCFIYYANGLKICGKIQAPTDPEDKITLAKRWACIVMAKCYSIACPDGELGIVHRAAISRKVGLHEFTEAIKGFRV